MDCRPTDDGCANISDVKTDMTRVRKNQNGEIAVTAQAKLNLFLHITGRRNDGYHLLESLFVFTENGDEIGFASSDRIELLASGPFGRSVPVDDSNLIVKAANLLKNSFDIKAGASISLTKNLPVASGIGGGSADAAATLVGLNDLWELGLSTTALEKLALELGADVPACITSRSALVRGIGEKLTPCSIGFEAGVVLVNPMAAVSTANIFAQFREFRGSRGMPAFDDPLPDPHSVCASIDALKTNTSNSLAGPAKGACAHIAEVEAALESDGRADMIRMSGSGATVFALYPTREIAHGVAENIQTQAPNWWVMADQLKA